MFLPHVLSPISIHYELNSPKATPSINPSCRLQICRCVTQVLRRTLLVQLLSGHRGLPRCRADPCLCQGDGS